MSIGVSRLESLDDLLLCERLQEQLLGAGVRSILTVPTLAAIRRSGGLLLGAWEAEGSRRTLQGALVDLAAEADGFTARFSVFLGVAPGSRNRGAAQSLRAAERAACRAAGVELVFWWADPLQSAAAHIAFNRLGAIAPAHIRNALGPLRDRQNERLATDRLRVEWWINAPRVTSILDDGRPPPHLEVGLDRMQVLTRTRAQSAGYRKPGELQSGPTDRFVLVEIPEDIDRLRAEDEAAALAWRVSTREAFELLFSGGYTIVGFVHEGGRSFHLFEREDRGVVLGRS